MPEASGDPTHPPADIFANQRLTIVAAREASRDNVRSWDASFAIGHQPTLVRHLLSNGTAERYRRCNSARFNLAAYN
jgi:hypothetical protein